MHKHKIKFYVCTEQRSFVKYHPGMQDYHLVELKQTLIRSLSVGSNAIYFSHLLLHALWKILGEN